jgi:hypothetical protein
VGLTAKRNNDYYQKMFQRGLFDFPPKFSYTEIKHNGKIVGIVQVESNAGTASPSVVSSDKAKPKLEKNQLWVRKGGKNVALNGSDLNDPYVKRIYSWVMQSPENSPGPTQRCAGASQGQQVVQLNTQPPDIKSRSSEAKAGANENPPWATVPGIEHMSVRSSESLEEDFDESKKNASNNCQAPAGIGYSRFMEALTRFEKGHFILLCGTLTNIVPNLDSLSLAPWIAVFDFDPSGRETGLLKFMEDSLRKTRSTVTYTWMDPHAGVTEMGTQWWSLRGRLDLPESNLADLSPLKWIKKVQDKVEKVCGELERFSQTYTILRIIVLWPNSKEEMKCMYMFLYEVLKRIRIHTSIYLWFTDEAGQEDSPEVQNIAEIAEENIHTFQQNLRDFCTETEQLFANNKRDGKFAFKLPCGDEQHVEISMERVAWLRPDLEALYIDNPYSQKDITSDDLESEGDNFYKGGSINWFARYDMRPNCFDVQRDISKDLVDHIKNVFIKECRRGVVKLFHAPGSGGSTMAQRVLFDLHETTPCVHLKQQSGSSIEDTADRLAFLHKETHMPVLVLVDGEEEQKLQFLQSHLRDCVMIFLIVRRCTSEIKTHSIPHRSIFFLKGTVTKQESRNLAVHLKGKCRGSAEKEKALSDLDWDVQKHLQDHQMFEYGMTVYEHEFRGIAPYVNGYLQVERGADLRYLKPWQKCLGFLALVYYYAQSSLPCFFIGLLMGRTSKRYFNIKDLPHPMHMFLVPDTNEGKRHYVRIMHYMVSKEILEQLLDSSSQGKRSEKLSARAKLNLKQLCLDFLDHIQEIGEMDCASFIAQSFLTKTFILREHEVESEVTLETKWKPQFSEVMLDLDSQPPYSGRLEVLQKLCEVCPNDASFKAHLGRFYSLCQPDKVEEAEKAFKDAVSIASATDHVQLANIYHMYGCYFQRKVNRQLKVKENAEYNQSSVIGDGALACEKFQLCRSEGHLGIKEDMHFINEIDVRLQICSYIRQHTNGGLPPLLQNDTGMQTEFHFVRESIVEIQDLVMECHKDSCLSDASLAELQKRVQQYNSLFKGCINELKALTFDDPVTTLRLKVTAKKLEHDPLDNVAFVENPKIDGAVLDYVVGIFEDIFQHADGTELKTKLDLDYMEWILAIRNTNFPRVRIYLNCCIISTIVYKALNSSYSC